MSAALARPMSVEEFLDWAEAQEGRFELEAGRIVAMAPERAVHARLKLSIARALSDAIARAGLPCEAFVEGLAVRIDETTAYAPDVVVHCGESLGDDEREVGNPVVVVEVLSASTAYRDLGRKARGYLGLASVAHYLVVDPDEAVVTHHRRGPGGLTEMRPLRDGDLVLDPPGLTLAVADLLPRRTAGAR